MKKICFSLILIFTFLSTLSVIQAKDQTNGEADPQTVFTLKQLMGKFGTLMAGIEILQMKEKRPDWQTIDLTLKEMTQVLNQMQAIDKNQAYKQYTDVLAAGLIDLKSKSEKKSKHIYNGFDKLVQTCFQCHAMHRPSDFLFPKDKPTAQTP